MQLLNIGCGKRTHQDWVNIDKIPGHSSVTQCDVEQGLPFLDCHFDVVYHSHVLEHLEMRNANQLVKECYRVLKPGGVIRVAVPDLEQIVLFYLQSLQKMSDGSDYTRDDYDWIMLELYDQVVRNSSGGRMADFLNRECISNRNFIVERCGVEVEHLMERFKKQRSCQSAVTPKKKLLKKPVFVFQPKKFFSILREQVIKILLGGEYKSLKVGRFRCSGENHQWMFDRISLRLILEECGFSEIIQRDAWTSYVQDWTKFNLDTEADGTVYKPDSLFMEALKP